MAVFLFSTFSTLISFYHKKTNLFVFSSIPFISILIFICIQNIYSPITTILDGRLNAYIEVFQFLKINDINAFLFGYKKGFADYSNLFLELFVRTGIIGTLGYLLSILLVIKFYFKTVKYNTINKLDLNSKLPLLFILSSFIFGNIANINISLPYYSINLVMVLCSYQFLLSQINIKEEYSTNVNPKFKK